MKLVGFEGRDIRTTADRVKESLFNILRESVVGADVLDLFCGSGNLGIECLSRGAEFVRFNDISKASIAVLKSNLARLKDDNYAVSNSDYKSCLSLGEKYGVEFSAHDPKEDARATLAVAKGCLQGKSLDAFLSEYGVHVGKFENGIVRKCYCGSFTAARKAKIENHNAVFDLVERLGQGDGQSYFIDNAITSECNASGLAEKILLSGGAVAASSYSADVVITNNLSLKADPKYISLKTALDRFSVPYDGYDFTPNKIRDESGKPISLTEYYSRAYKKFARDGALNGKSVAFSKGAERRRDFDDLVLGVIKNGGSICPRVDNADYFVVENKSDIKKNFSDGRIKAYLHGRQATLMDIKELKSLLS